jgi:hypothetical protein
MEINFSEIIKNKNNEPCVIVGPGPTMLDFPYKDFDGTIITIGDAALRGRDILVPDFWVCSNSHFPVPEINYHLDIINSFNETIFVFAESELYGLLWKKSDEYLNKNLKINWLMFDERHFNGKSCFPRKQCCDLIKTRSGVHTIQELVSKIFKSKEVAKQGGTVFEYALCLSLILGCNPIYIQGVDLPILENKKKIDYVKVGDLGQEYLDRPEFEKELKAFYKKTSNDISIQSKKISKMKIVYLFLKINILINKIYSYIFGNKKKGFYESIDVILNNCKIYAKIAKENNIQIFNLSANSTLRKLENINFLSSNELKINSKRKDNI